jgi:hypothetical protein
LTFTRCRVLEISPQEPMYGLRRVARFLSGLNWQGVRANGQPAARLVAADGSVLGVLIVDVVDGRVAALRIQINPDKLRHLGRVGNLTELMRTAGSPG